MATEPGDTGPAKGAPEVAKLGVFRPPLVYLASIVDRVGNPHGLAAPVLSWCGDSFYLYLARVSVPIFGTSFIETPEVSGVRSIVHAVLFVIFFYAGFIRKWESRSIK
jgi:hypothetical protein